MRLLRAPLSIAFVMLIVVAVTPLASGANQTPKKSRRARTAKNLASAHRMETIEQAERRAAAAEQRAQEAEAAAGRAAIDAQAAREQAQQAMGLARRASDALAEIQQRIAGLEKSGTQTAEEIAAAKKSSERLSTEIGQTRSDTAAAARKLDAVDKRTEGAATSQSKIPLKIYGSVLLSTNFVDGGANNNDVPLFGLTAKTSADQNHENFNMTVRQTRFGLRYEGKAFADARLTGVFEFDLFGGKPAFANGVDFDLFRVRLAYGRIDWKNNSLEAGQDWTVFAPLNPTTIASYAITGFSTSGNLWNRIPQIRYEHRADIGEKAKFVFTAAALDPNAGDNAGNPAARGIGLGERGGLPSFESRFGFTAETHGKESSLGVSTHYSRLLGEFGNPAGTAVRSPIDSYGVAGDWNAWLSSGLRVSGEIFHGRALGILSGEIAQPSVVIAGRARGINSSGGWIELHAESPAGYDGPWKRISANAGYGIEDNRDEDLLAGLRKRNQTVMANGQFKLATNFTMALEYRHLMTDYFAVPTAYRGLNWANLSFLYSF